MSFQAMTWAVEQELPAMQKIVLLMLANRTNNDTGICYPSLERLAKECGMEKRSVINQVSKLESAGLLSVSRSMNEKGYSNANQYRLNLKAVGKLKAGSETDLLGVVKEIHHGSETDSPKPVNEPVTINQKDNLKESAPKKAKNSGGENGNEKRESKAVFKKPTAEEVELFRVSNGLRLDVQHFIDHFESNGWLVGNKTPMKDWQAAVRNWVRREEKWNKGGSNATHQQSDKRKLSANEQFQRAKMRIKS